MCHNAYRSYRFSKYKPSYTTFLVTLCLMLAFAMTTTDEVKASESLSNYPSINTHGETSHSPLDAVLKRSLALLSEGNKQTIELPDINSNVAFIAYRPDGKLIVIKDNNIVYLLDPRSKKIIHQKRYQQAINQFAVNSDRTLLALGLSGGSIRLIDTGSWKETATIQKQDHVEEVTALAFNHDSSVLAIGQKMDFFRYYRVALWNTAAGEAITTARVGSRVETMAFQKDNRFLALGLDRWEAEGMWDMVTHGSTIELWDTREPEANLKSEYVMTLGVKKILVTPDGQDMIVGVRDLPDSDFSSEIARWALNGENLQRKLLSNEYKGLIRDMHYSPNKQFIAVAYSDQNIRLLISHTLQELFSFNIGTDIRSLAYSPDGNHIAINGEKGSVAIWDVPSFD